LETNILMLLNLQCSIAGNTLFCWPENELHGTTVLPMEGVTCGLSQNLAKKTATAAKKWRDGKEAKYRVDYRQKQLTTNPQALQALEESVIRNKEKTDARSAGQIILKGTNYAGEYINIEENDHSWV